MQLNPVPDHILVDGPHPFSALHQQTPVIDGDARSFTIAAASVLAKVTRDRLMREMDGAFPGYGFAEHKGYGTPGHLEALKKLGPCAIHRRSFALIRQPANEPDLFQDLCPSGRI
jgi:ribonuclease HII